jgi:hypothetical protein
MLSIGRGGASQTRRLLLLRAGGWVPPDVGPSGACLTRGSSILYQPLHAAAGDTTPGRRLFRCTLVNRSELHASAWCMLSRAVLVLRDDGHLLGHGPHEACQLTGNGHGDHMGGVASCHESSVACTAPHLGLPTNVLDHFGLVCQSPLPVTTELRGRTVGPGAFAQEASGMGVARLGNRPRSAWLTGGLF